MTSSLFGTNLMRLAQNIWVEQKTDGSMDLTSATDGTNAAQPGPSGINILPAQNVASNRLHPGGPPAGTCGRDKRQFCPMAWPKALPIPRTPVGATQIYSSPASAAISSDNFTQCGQYCQGPKDCSSSEVDDQCLCAVPSQQDARKLGLDPVAPVSVCLALVGAAVSSLAGRDEIKYLDEIGAEYQCPCNRTYTAPACCGSKDGLIGIG